jgi:hypothetical protein
MTSKGENVSDERDDCDNVIDLMSVRIRRLCENAMSAEELEVATTLYDLYVSGDVIASIREGELFFQWVGDDPPTTQKEFPH